MIKRILVPLDDDLDTAEAMRCAAGIAERHDAMVTGVAVVDTDTITATTSGAGIGSIDFASDLHGTLLGRGRSVARALVEGFASRMDGFGVRHEEQVLEGPPFERIIEAMRVHDLQVVGRVPHFYYPQPETETETLARIVREVVAPTLIVGEDEVRVRRVLVGYDGSNAAARTVQRFAQLQPFGSDLSVAIVNVRTAGGEEARAASEAMVEGMARYLRAHGFSDVAAESVEGREPPARLLELARASEAGLIVAGAHSVSKISRLVFGSTTHALIEDGSFPLFVFH